MGFSDPVSRPLAEVMGVDMMRIEYLADRKEFIPELARLHFQEWGYLRPEQTLEARIESLRACCGHRRIPTVMVATIGLVENLIFQIAEYKNHGFEVLGITGINRSPGCGVDTTSDHNKEIRGRSLFIGSLNKALHDQKFSIKTIGIKASEIDTALNSVKGLIESY